MINVYEQVDRNKRRSFFIMAFFVIFITSVVWLLAKAFSYGPGIIGVALIISGLMSFASYWWSDKIILTISRARPANKKQDFQFFTVAENLSLATQIPMPKLYVIEDSAPNAFATGRDLNHSVVCATTGLLAKLNRTELEGVIAHEISHIRNYDMLLMSIVTVLVGMVVLISDWFSRSLWYGNRSRNREEGNSGAIFLIIGLVLALLSPLVAKLIQLSISRRREFMADASAVMITRYPNGLIKALEKISVDKEPLEVANKATAHLYIVNPFKGEQAKFWLSNLFNTHPPMEERIKALKAMV
ncbi:MAG: M48 family metallopeptidase [Candidatus Shapirobacteria bacterium]|nr:M48 family metallopeptidase [Candidatus Shapirobacteria bacterium]